MSEPIAQPSAWSTANVLHRLGQISGFADKTVGGLKIPGGPIPGFLTSTALGTGLGWLGSKIVNWFHDSDDDENAARTRRWMILGGLGLGAPAALHAYAAGAEGFKQRGVGGLFFNKQSSVWGNVPVSQSLGLIAADPWMTPAYKALAANVLLTANNQQPAGYLTYGDLFRGAVGSGLGTIAGAMFAKTMDGLFGLPTPVKTWLSQTGAIAGALMGSGIARPQ